MRRLLVLFLLLLLVAPALADEKKPAEPRTAPLTIDQAAEKVREAVRTKDGAALKALAEGEDPDPWLVADVLMARDEHDTAEAFARAGKRSDTEKLPAYVASRRGKRDDTATRKALAGSVAASREGDSAGARAALKDVQPESGTVLEVLVGYGRASLLLSLGVLEEAAVVARTASDAAARLGWYRQAARIQHGQGAGRFARNDLDGALEAYDIALEMQRRRGDRAGIAETLTELAKVHLRMGQPAQAVVEAERAWSIQKQLGDRHRALDVLWTLGKARLASGEAQDGMRLLVRAVGEARHLRRSRLMAHVLADLARARLDTGDSEGALRTALDALPILEVTLAALAGEEAINARAAFTSLYETGILAAHKSGDLDAVSLFLESGRAAGLLTSLAGGRALRAVVFPEELLRAEVEARQSVVTAQQAFRAALSSADMKTLRRLRKDLSSAQESLLVVHERMQRAATRLAGLLAPRVTMPADVRASLGHDQALVSYAFVRGEVLALVLTTESTALVSLGSSDKLSQVIQAHDLENVQVPGERTFVALRQILVEPLSLPAAATTVLIVPAGSIGTLPLAAIFDRPVALLPSATIYTLLKERATGRGRGVLALGDPAYGDKSGVGGTRFTQLPETRLEAEAVGTDVLLGADASESGLSVALGRRPRWRAVHFACHAAVDFKRPMLSALALSPDKTSDGLLTCLEIYRMEIPTDLVVLAGANTALGKIYPDEGIVGLVRAFMNAGAPRVIGSIWCVDDAATRALMTKFYELWDPQAKPGDPERPKGVERAASNGSNRDGKKSLGAAAALKRAQDYVKGHKKWKHPFYWAGWVLWGVPD